MPGCRGERGAALVIAILALTVIGALVAAAFFAGTQEQRMAEHARRWQRAFGAAESGLAELVRQWPDAAASLDLYPADSLALASAPTPGGTGYFAGLIRRMGPDLFLVDVTGRDRADRARQRLGLLVRVTAPCDSAIVDGVELSPLNCYNNNGFPNLGAVGPLPSRSWIQLY